MRFPCPLLGMSRNLYNLFKYTIWLLMYLFLVQHAERWGWEYKNVNIGKDRWGQKNEIFSVHCFLGLGRGNRLEGTFTNHEPCDVAGFTWEDIFSALSFMVWSKGWCHDSPLILLPWCWHVYDLYFSACRLEKGDKEKWLVSFLKV